MDYDFRSAGFELTNLVIELYRTRTYRRAAEEMSKKMLQSAVSAGQLISAVQDVSGADQAAVAGEAIKALDDMVYVISTMKRMGVYPAKALSPVMRLARTVKARLIDAVVENKPKTETEKTRAVNETVPAESGSVAAQSPVKKQETVDEDGFYDDATEYL